LRAFHFFPLAVGVSALPGFRILFGQIS